MAGVLSAFLYSVAFALELWWIIEAKGKTILQMFRSLSCDNIVLLAFSR
jgi:hypothetical protein